MNLAALWRLPVLFICENNLYAMGSALSVTEAVTDFTAKAASYGVAAFAVNGMDVLAVEAAARNAVMAIRAGQGPFSSRRVNIASARSMFDANSIAPEGGGRDWKKHGRSSRSRLRLKAKA
jgi:hypothetical protein